MNFKINSRPLFTIIFKLKNDNFKTRDFSPLIERVLSWCDLYDMIKTDYSMNAAESNVHQNTSWLTKVYIYQAADMIKAIPN